MSEIVPWTDPGGTPCCCITNCAEPIANSAYRDIELTLDEYVAFYAGGTLVTQITGSASLTYTPAIPASMSGSGSVSYTRTNTIFTSPSPLAEFRGPSCDKSTTDADTDYQPNCTSSITSNGTQETVRCFWGRGQGVSLKPYNNGATNAYGLQISVGNPHQFVVEGQYVAPSGSLIKMAAIVAVPTSMSAANDNATFDLILPSRTVAVPYRRGLTFSQVPNWGGTVSGTAQINSHVMTYSPSAP